MLSRRDLACVLALSAVARPVALPGPAAARGLDAAAVGAWIDAYGAAWRERDAEAAAALFAPEATYHESSIEQPLRGREAVRLYWQAVTAGKNEASFAHEIWSLEGQDAVACWTATLTVGDGSRVVIDGAFHLTFADPVTVLRLRKWWFATPA